MEVLRAFGEPLTIGGDGRRDSPDHSAKYSSYNLELRHNVVLDIELVQVCTYSCLAKLEQSVANFFFSLSSNEVGSSYHMEKEGLVGGIKFM